MSLYTTELQCYRVLQCGSRIYLAIATTKFSAFWHIQFYSGNCFPFSKLRPLLLKSENFTTFNSLLLGVQGRAIDR